MESNSVEGLDSNKGYRQWLAETFHGPDTAEDEDNLNGNDAMNLPSIENLPLTLNPLEPFVGMEFNSAEDAREFYEMYGRRVGFTIRNNRTRRSLKDNSIIGREFVCSKEGFRAHKSANIENKGLRHGTREGCNAMLRIGVKGGGKWVVNGFLKEHNHELNPSKIPPRRSHRIAFCEDKKDLKIRELTTEVHRERKRSAAYEQQLEMILSYVEEHTKRLSINVDSISNTLNQLELNDSD